jgi:hypothetical protein
LRQSLSIWQPFFLSLFLLYFSRSFSLSVQPGNATDASPPSPGSLTRISLFNFALARINHPTTWG